MKPNNILLLLIGLLLNSCIGDVDFDQAQNLSITPIIKTSILYFNATPSDFVNPITNDPITFRSDTTEVHLFDSDLAQKDVTKIILKFNIENTFNKNFDLSYTFLDQNNVITTIIPFNIQNNNIIEQEITYENTELPQLLNAKKIIATVILHPNQNTITSAMFLKFKSAADIYFLIDDN